MVGKGGQGGSSRKAIATKVTSEILLGPVDETATGKYPENPEKESTDVFTTYTSFPSPCDLSMMFLRKSDQLSHTT